jgi:hypothetical protein
VLLLLLSCRHLDRHLDADEAVVLGAGLFAANLSSSFRLRVRLDDMAPHCYMLCYVLQLTYAIAQLLGTVIDACSLTKLSQTAAAVPCSL